MGGTCRKTSTPPPRQIAPVVAFVFDYKNVIKLMYIMSPFSKKFRKKIETYTTEIQEIEKNRQLKSNSKLQTCASRTTSRTTHQTTSRQYSEKIVKPENKETSCDIDFQQQILCGVGNKTTTFSTPHSTKRRFAANRRYGKWCICQS